MDGEAVAVVMANSAAFSRMDVEAMLAHYAADAEVVDHRRVSLGSFRGHEELRAFYLSIVHSASELFEEITVLAQRGGSVVVACELRGRLAAAPARTADVVVPYGMVVEVADAKIRRLELHESGEDALAAAGIEASG